MKCKNISLKYEPGFYQNSNGNRKNSLRFNEAAWCRTNGHGYYWLGKNAKYILSCETENGEPVEVNIRWMFGKNGIRLTKNIRSLLEDSLPEYFEIEHDDEFNNYYVIWDDFNKWISASGISCN